MRSIVIFRFFSHLSLLFVYQCITFLPLIFRFSFYNNMIQFINSIDSDNVTYLQKVKGKKGGSSKENLINKKLNELWDSFNVSVESAE